MHKGFFFSLTPDQVLHSVEASGLLCTGRCMALNSYENRVYDVELETEPTQRRIAKFYRPGRWTREQILEEHHFLKELSDAEIPAIDPLPFPDGSTLQKTSQGDIWYALFPKVGGRAPDELSDEQIIRIGRLLGRIHALGAKKQSCARLHLTPQTYGLDNLHYLKAHHWIPVELENRYTNAVEKLCKIAEPWFKETLLQRIHGDCHLGNLLWNNSGPFFLDFDDMVVGPTVQDIWLLTPGRDEDSLRQRELLIEGYQEFGTFHRRDLRLIEVLRAFRYIHYATWIAKRWEDPAFPLTFPHFGTFQYWSGQTDNLEEQVQLIQ